MVVVCFSQEMVQSQCQSYFKSKLFCRHYGNACIPTSSRTIELVFMNMNLEKHHTGGLEEAYVTKAETGVARTGNAVYRVALTAVKKASRNPDLESPKPV